jgi:hypothetical protein
MKQFKRYLAVGCSHGIFADPEALAAVLEFKKRWKPDTILHLGDFVDLAALRSGAMGNANCKDRAQSITDDLSQGLSFLKELSPKHILLGNHEARIYQLTDSPNAVAARAAMSIVQELEECRKKLKAQLYPYNIRSYAQLGDTKFLHGFVYNVNAIRDTAESYGCKTVMAHIHRVGQERARTLSGVSGYACGMLARFDMEYAMTRRATLGWSQGFAWGEYNDKQCSVNLCERTYGTQWQLPI